MLSVLNAENQYSVLPPAYAAWWVDNYSGPYNSDDTTFFFSLLPFFEQGAIGQSISDFGNTSKSVLGPINDTQAAMSVPLSVLIAPNDASAPQDGVFVDGCNIGWMWRRPVDVALASYGCNWQVFGDPEFAPEDIWEWRNGAGDRRLRQILDGTSNTVFVAERQMGCGPASEPNNTDTFGNSWGYTADDRYWPVFARTNIAFTDNPEEIEYNQFFPPISTPNPGECRWAEYRAIGHSAGIVLVGMGDGAVRTVSDTIDIIPWSHLILPGDGQVIQDALN